MPANRLDSAAVSILANRQANVVGEILYGKIDVEVDKSGHLVSKGPRLNAFTVQEAQGLAVAAIHNLIIAARGDAFHKLPFLKKDGSLDVSHNIVKNIAAHYGPEIEAIAKGIVSASEPEEAVTFDEHGKIIVIPDEAKIAALDSLAKLSRQVLYLESQNDLNHVEGKVSLIMMDAAHEWDRDTYDLVEAYVESLIRSADKFSAHSKYFVLPLWSEADDNDITNPQWRQAQFEAYVTDLVQTLERQRKLILKTPEEDAHSDTTSVASTLSRSNSQSQSPFEIPTAS